MFNDFIRIVKLNLPDWVVLENVQGIMGTCNGLFLKKILKGIDYKLAEQAAGEILSMRFGRIFGRVVRYIYAKTKPFVWVRHKLIYVYSKYTTNFLIRWIKGN